MAAGISFEGDEDRDEKDERSPLDSQLDSLLGELPPAVEEPEPELEEPAEKVEAKKEPEAEDAEDGEETPDGVPRETKDEGDDGKPESGEERERKRAEGLLKALTELRSKNQELRSQLMQRQAPSPARQFEGPPMPASGQPLSAAQQQAAQRAGIPVKVTADEVYVDQDALERLVDERASRIVEERTRPTPEQQRNAEVRHVAMEFVAADPESNRPVVEEISAADQYLELALQNGIMTRGHYQTVDEAIEYLEASGVANQVREHFPAVGENLASFIRAFASQDVNYKRDALRMIGATAARLRQSAVPEVEDENPAPPPAIRPVQGVPKSMAKMGGTRPKADVDEEREFAALEKRFTKDPFALSQKEYKAYHRLAKKLGKDLD